MRCETVLVEIVGVGDGVEEWVTGEGKWWQVRVSGDRLVKVVFFFCWVGVGGGRV